MQTTFRNVHSSRFSRDPFQESLLALVISSVPVALVGDDGVDERDEDVASALGGGKPLVEVSEAAWVHQQVTLLQVRHRAVVPDGYWR